MPDTSSARSYARRQSLDHKAADKIAASRPVPSQGGSDEQRRASRQERRQDTGEEDAVEDARSAGLCGILDAQPARMVRTSVWIRDRRIAFMKKAFSVMPTPRTIRVEPGSELSRLLDEDDETPIVLEKDGARYRVTRVVMPVESDDIWAGYDRQRSLARLQSAAGGWSGLVDAETFKAYVAERRQIANRPSIRR